MKYIFSIITIISVLVTGTTFAKSVSTLEQIQKTETIRIGYRNDQPPMSFVDQNNQPVGYSLELCLHIVNQIKVQLKNPNIAIKYVPVTATNRFAALTNNAIDILCGSTTKTLSRSALVDFTELTFVTGASLISLKTSEVANLKGLAGKKVAVVKNTTTIKTLSKALKKIGSDAEIIAVDSAAEGIAAVHSHKVAAFSADQIVLIGLAIVQPDPTQYILAKELFSFEPYALAIRRNDADFRLLSNSVLSRLYRTGKVTETYSHWFGKHIKNVPNLLQAMYILNSTAE